MVESRRMFELVDIGKKRRKEKRREEKRKEETGEGRLLYFYVFLCILMPPISSKTASLFSLFSLFPHTKRIL